LNTDQEKDKSTESLQALRDIDFIKQLIARNGQKMDQSPPFLFIWGSYLAIGMIGMQFDRTDWPMWYWPIATVVCSILSALVGYRLSRRIPVREGGTNGWMFWFPFLMMMLAGVLMMATGMVKQEYLPLFWFILVGILYISMGTLIGKGPVILGVWFIILAAVTRLFFIDYQFLILGLLGGGSVVLAGCWLHRRRRRHE